MKKKEKWVSIGVALFAIGFVMLLANTFLPMLLGESAEAIMEWTTLVPLVFMPAGILLAVYASVSMRE